MNYQPLSFSFPLSSLFIECNVACFGQTPTEAHLCCIVNIRAEIYLFYSVSAFLTTTYILEVLTPLVLVCTHLWLRVEQRVSILFRFVSKIILMLKWSRCHVKQLAAEVLGWNNNLKKRRCFYLCVDMQSENINL